MCTCGKRRYYTRKAAKAAAREVDPGGHSSAYKCGSAWHWGHLLAAVIRGYIDRSAL